MIHRHTVHGDELAKVVLVWVVIAVPAPVKGVSFKFNGGASQYFGGAIYLPTADATFVGGAATSTSCTQLIANTISFSGNSSFAINCNSYGTRTFSTKTLKLVS